MSLKAKLWALMFPSPGAERGAGVAVGQRGGLVAVGLLEAVAHEEAVVLAQRVVDLDVELVVLPLQWSG